jgi:hypothetical protein
MNKTFIAACALVLLAAGSGQASAGPATFVIINANAAGVGFNDPAPRDPVGGNTGVTLGEQRLKAFEYAASLWSKRLDSKVQIRIQARFTALGPNVLGSAGAINGVLVTFTDGSKQIFHPALANSLFGFDVLPNTDDINANFSSDFDFYLGLDGNHGSKNDLVAVLLHEFAHGLGFAQYGSVTSGAMPTVGGVPVTDVYNQFLLDTSTGKYWIQMTDAQRVAAATRFGRIVLDAPGVKAALPSVLSFGSPELQVKQPAAIAASLQFGTAAFGPRVGSPNVSAAVVAALDPSDAAGTATTDGCSAFTNPGAVAGKIALVERGTCGFAVKARNATEAGAVAVIIYNNAANANAAPAGMADDGINGPLVTVPTVSLTRADGLAIVTQLPNGVVVNLAVDPTIRAGADAAGRPRVYAPFPIAGGSSISHYDTVAFRNLLMEPAISSDLTHNLKAPFDLTFELLHDEGWNFPDADQDNVVDDEDCNAHSDLRTTIFVGGINTGVPNTFFQGGCTSADLIAQIGATSANHGDFVSRVAALRNDWRNAGLISGAQNGAIESAAARTR